MSMTLTEALEEMEFRAARGNTFDRATYEAVRDALSEFTGGRETQDCAVVPKALWRAVCVAVTKALETDKLAPLGDHIAPAELRKMAEVAEKGVS